MAQPPTYYQNSPSAGSQYWSPMPYGVIAAAGDYLDVNMRVWSGANGTGSEVTCDQIDVWCWHEYGASMAHYTYYGGTWCHVGHTVAGGEAGYFTQISAKFTGPHAGVGSIQMWLTYSTSQLYVPVNISFSPNIGGPGTPVDIYGNHLEAVSGCWFNADNPPGGGTGATITPDSETHATTTVPTGAKYGKIQIGNAAGTVLSAASFTPGTIEVDDGGAYQYALRAWGDSGNDWQGCNVWADDGSIWRQVS